MKYSEKQIREAFLKWNKELREKPNNFMTDEQVSSMGDDKLADECTKTLIDYIK